MEFTSNKVKYVIAFLICAGIALLVFIQDGEKVRITDKYFAAGLFAMVALVIIGGLYYNYKSYIITENEVQVNNIFGNQIDSIGFDEIGKIYTHRYTSATSYRGMILAAGTGKILNIELKDGQQIELNISDMNDDEGFVQLLRERLGDHMFYPHALG